MTLRSRIDTETYCSEQTLLDSLIKQADLNASERAKISLRAANLVDQVRTSSKPSLMEVFLDEYGLSTDEGVALMCLAEALLRVSDTETMDALIEDKVSRSDWEKHLGQSTSSLVNASTWALLLTGKILNEGDGTIVGVMRRSVKRLGEPVIRAAVSRAMQTMGHQFVLGEDMAEATRRAKEHEDQGYTYSYDMLGEAAKTDDDAKGYHLAYSRSITAISAKIKEGDIRDKPGISVKLSALHPRYELAQRDRVMSELVPRLRSLAMLAKSAGIGLNVDAEEADRLSLSMDVIENVLREPSLTGWDGFGVVVQAYGKRASFVLDYLYELAGTLDRRIMVRLVKGAYWDTEIKAAQVLGLPDYPVFTTKAATDVSYIANARKLFEMSDRIYPQFATHNAHTVAAILEMAPDDVAYEFQRLHGMGESVYDLVKEADNIRCRIYAPVGTHRDLLAYLVRRLLENGANSSFVNQIVDQSIPAEQVAADPFETVKETTTPMRKGTELFMPERPNSEGYDLRDQPTLDQIEKARAPFQTSQFDAKPLMVGKPKKATAQKILNPFDSTDCVGTVLNASASDAQAALDNAKPWNTDAAERAKVLNRAADLYEENAGAIFALLTREAGKTLMDCVAELREAVDFLRYYAANIPTQPAAGLFVCISPWNFPLAIFSGQIAAALATGNAVIAKPADQTPLIGCFAAELMHKAGVPISAFQLLPGSGAVVGAALTSDPRVNGLAFTGSTQTAKIIQSVMANSARGGTPLIAETGGLNAMVVDSTALLEQAVTAIIESSFQSAGQRCSALRCLYVQEDIRDDLLEMLIGAAQELQLGNPWDLATDVGPVIDDAARTKIADYIKGKRNKGRVMFEGINPSPDHFIAPTIIEVADISEMAEEIFGPVLHVASFSATGWEQVIEQINETGYGLTFGLQTRIDDRVQYVTQNVRAGNLYVNRNQIGAIVGSQPFGGEGMSGTGPKAGGPEYLARFCTQAYVPLPSVDEQSQSAAEVQKLIDQANGGSQIEEKIMPGPTGELNQLSLWARSPLLCLGPTDAARDEQMAKVTALGGRAVVATLSAETLETLTGFSGAIWWGEEVIAQEFSVALANRAGPIIPLITGKPDRAHVTFERHLCVDTTASGGNVDLLTTI